MFVHLAAVTGPAGGDVAPAVTASGALDTAV